MKTESFFKEDFFSSPKYRDDKTERETLKIRYENGSKVVSRSICGTKESF